MNKDVNQVLLGTDPSIFINIKHEFFEIYFLKISSRLITNDAKVIDSDFHYKGIKSYLSILAYRSLFCKNEQYFLME